MRPRRSPTAIAVLAVTSGAVRADSENLQEFLRSVEVATDVTAPLRADGQIEITAAGKTTRDEIALVVRPLADQFIELHDADTRALLLDSGQQAHRFTKGATKAEDFAADAMLAATDFSREDLQPFRLARFKDIRISDESDNEMTVTFFPNTSQYILLVITFDRERKVPLKTIYYRETLNNAVKMRRDGGYTLVGRKWLPTTISMESFKLKTRTAVTLRWTQNPTFPPELFDPAFLARPSLLVWPSAAPPAAQ